MYRHLAYYVIVNSGVNLRPALKKIRPDIYLYETSVTHSTHKKSAFFWDQAFNEVLADEISEVGSVNSQHALPPSLQWQTED